MTPDERLDRIEHFTATLAEERRKDREEYKTLWRDTQRQLNELSSRLIDWAEESRTADARLLAADSRLAEADERAREEFRAVDKALAERIAALVSGLGEFMRRKE